MINQYKKLIKRCITIAKKAEGKTSPNPMVGAVIFDDDFNIISEGYHKKYGEKHAEVDAIENTTQTLKGLSIAVNLEPCSHQGKTPPCADRLIKEGFKRVIIGTVDPNPLVGGKGIKKLQNAGIEVITGILEKDCLKLNEFFIKNHVERKTFVAIKTATSLDGKIACSTGDSKWITSEKARNRVQKLRNNYDAILTGSNTVEQDDPKLTCRLKKGKNPIRIIIDSKLKTKAKRAVYNNDGTEVYIVTNEKFSDSDFSKYPPNVNFIKCTIKNNHIDLEELLEKLYHMGIKSLMVEAGGKLNSALIEKKLVDKLIQFIAPKIIGDNKAISFVDGQGIPTIDKTTKLQDITTKAVGQDTLIEAYFNK